MSNLKEALIGISNESKAKTFANSYSRKARAIKYLSWKFDLEPGSSLEWITGVWNEISDFITFRAVIYPDLKKPMVAIVNSYHEFKYERRDLSEAAILATEEFVREFFNEKKTS